MTGAARACRPATIVLAVAASLVLPAKGDAANGLPAIAQFAGLLEAMHRAHATASWPAYKARATELLDLLNGSPDAILEVARADAVLGNDSAALADLQSVAVMGQSRAEVVEALPEFSRLKSGPRFVRILREMAANAAPVSRATQAFALADPGLVPEDIDYDARSRRFFITSVLEKKVVALDPAGRVSDFARAPDGWPMLALKVDARRSLVWATEDAIEGFASVAKADWGRSALLAYDLSSRKLVLRAEAPKGAQLGDMTLAPDGAPLVSDGTGGVLYTFDQRHARLKPVDTRDFISPQTPAYAAPAMVFVPDYVRGIGLLDLKSRHVRWLPMDRRFALEGTDGLYYYRGRLIAVQNGTLPERVVTFALAANRTRVVAQRVVESGTSRLDPTHGVVVGNEFYYLANVGWNRLDARGTVKPGATLTPAHVERARIEE